MAKKKSWWTYTLVAVSWACFVTGVVVADPTIKLSLLAIARLLP